jgi:hypothetical protein
MAKREKRRAETPQADKTSEPAAATTAAPEVETKSLGGRPPFAPTEQDRRTVEMMVAFKIPQTEICLALSRRIDPKTLRIHFREELDTGEAKYKLAVGRAVTMHLFGRKAEYDETGKMLREEIKPDRAMAMFQAKVVLGQREMLRIEQIMTPEALRALTDDECELFERLWLKVVAASQAAVHEPGDGSGADESREGATLN